MCSALVEEVACTLLLVFFFSWGVEKGATLNFSWRQQGEPETGQESGTWKIKCALPSDPSTMMFHIGDFKKLLAHSNLSEERRTEEINIAHSLGISKTEDPSTGSAKKFLQTKRSSSFEESTSKQ